MSYPGYQNSLLLDQFREFYQELTRQRDLATGRLLELTAEGQTAVPAEGAEWHTLLRLLSTLEKRAISSGGAFAREVYLEAQFVMASLADEVFLNENWQGRSGWLLLESRLFQSHAAGEEFFDRLDLLLKRRDPVYTDLAAVYFCALSLGFQGKYRDNDPHGRLVYYKRELFALVFRRRPELREPGAHLFPQSYSHLLQEEKIAKLPHPRTWWLLLCGVLLAWVMVSHALWVHLSAPVEQELSDIINQAYDEGKAP
ncbi:MAG TPA: DotU family type IV/VI secretion system protein [Candidatus Saccharimonadales bacterium]|jgi:type VI secretion system protein ImpK|nr:DotU family type IV/VI secretion system protein [Candidatus Saccharimonadales bacterium]